MDGESFGVQFIKTALEVALTQPLCAGLSHGWIESSELNSTALLYEDFWSRVLGTLKAAPLSRAEDSQSSSSVVSSSSAKLNNVVRGKSSSSRGAKSSADEFVDEKCSAVDSREASPYRTILVFDEAHVLINNSPVNAPKISLFRVLRRSLWELKDVLERLNVLVVFMDTTSQVSTFTPPDEQDNSRRPTAAVTNQNDFLLLIYPPFSAIGSRPNDFTRLVPEIASPILPTSSSLSKAGARGSTESSATASASCSSIQAAATRNASPSLTPMMLRGRPLWRAYFNALLAQHRLSGKHIETAASSSMVALVDYAKTKLLGGRSQFSSSDPALMYPFSASVGCCLLNLVVDPASQLSATLVHSHMVR